MKLRAPDGCAAVSHEGRAFAIAADGSIDVEDRVAAALAAHGFTPWHGEARNIADATRDAGVAIDPDRAAKDDIDSLNRPALFALLRGKGVRVSLPISNAELRAVARRALAAKDE